MVLHTRCLSARLCPSPCCCRTAIVNIAWGSRPCFRGHSFNWNSPCRFIDCRYLSHFRSVHRGAYFAELRTTTVRKLLPESWGFLCPVHTPDGSPCGLLTHLTAACRLVTHRPGQGEEEENADAIAEVGWCSMAMCFTSLSADNCWIVHGRQA